MELSRRGDMKNFGDSLLKMSKVYANGGQKVNRTSFYFGKFASFTNRRIFNVANPKKKLVVLVKLLSYEEKNQ